MNYEVINIKGEEYKLRLGSVHQIALEKKLGKPILMVIAEMQESGKELESFYLETVLTIFAALLKKHHKEIKEKDVFDLYDDFVDEGGDAILLFTHVVQALLVSGVIPKEATMAQLQQNQQK